MVLRTGFQRTDDLLRHSTSSLNLPSLRLAHFGSSCRSLDKATDQERADLLSDATASGPELVEC